MRNVGVWTVAAVYHHYISALRESLTHAAQRAPHGARGAYACPEVRGRSAFLRSPRALWLKLLLLQLLAGAAVSVAVAVEDAGVIPTYPEPSVRTEGELLAAVRNESVQAVRLPVNMRLTSPAWPAMPVNRSSNFTIVGDDFYPILDLSFIESKIQLKPGVVFTFYQVELRNTRQRYGYEVDIFSASPNATVRFDHMVFHCFSCMPVARLYTSMESATPSTLPQKLSWGSWCRTQPALAACYDDGVISITTASILLPTSGFQNVASAGGYTLEATNVLFVCEKPTTDECGVSQGYDQCVRSEIAKMYAQDDTWEILAHANASNSAGGGAGGGAVIGGAVGGSIGGLLLVAALATVLVNTLRRRRTARDLSSGRAAKPDSEDDVASVQVHIGPDDDTGKSGPISQRRGSASDGCEAAPKAAHAAFETLTSDRTTMSCTQTSGAPVLSPLERTHEGAVASGLDAPSGRPFSDGFGSLPTSSADGNGLRDAGGASLSLRTASDSTVTVAGITIDLSTALGTGSFGKVFQGTWRGRSVAVKVLQYGSDLCRAVHNEVTLSQSLRHPNVVAALYFAQVLPGGRVGLHTGAPQTGSLGSGPTSSAALTEIQPQRPHSATGSTALGSPQAAVVDAGGGMEGGPVAAGRYARFIIPGADSTAGASALGFGASLSQAPLPSCLRVPEGDAAWERRPEREPHSAGDVEARPGGEFYAGAAAAVRSVFPLSGEAASASIPSLQPLTQGSPTALHSAERNAPSGGAERAECGDPLPTKLSGDNASCALRPALGRNSAGSKEQLQQNGDAERASRDQDELGSCGVATQGAVAGAGTEETVAESSMGNRTGGTHGQSAPPAQTAISNGGGAPGPGEPALQQARPLRAGGQLAASPEATTGSDAALATAARTPAPVDKLLPQACPQAACTASQNGASTDSRPSETARSAAHAAEPPAVAAAPSALPLAAAGPAATAAAGPSPGHGPLQALWLAANAQPVEGSSHGFLVMELCEGGSAAAWRSAQWRNPGELPNMATLVRLALDIAYGMCYIHSMGVCHGDLKLSNVLLARAPEGSRPGGEAPAVQADVLAGWVAKLCDFGLSRVLIGDRTHVSTRPFGTPTHMAPELWTKGHVSQHGDVYAFGILLWELATGRRPYKGLNAANILHTVLLGGERPPLPPWLPPPYSRLAAWCWAQAPKERPTFAEIVRQLEAMLVALGSMTQT